MSYSPAGSPGALILKRSGLRLTVVSALSVGGLGYAFAAMPWFEEHTLASIALSLGLFFFVVRLLESKSTQTQPSHEGVFRKTLEYGFSPEGARTTSGFEIVVRNVSDVTILDLHGKMTLGEGDELLRTYVIYLVNRGQTKLLLNLQDVPYIDSAGLGEVVRTYTVVSRAGGDLKFLNLTNRIEDLAAIAAVFDSESKAVESFSTEGAT